MTQPFVGRIGIVGSGALGAFYGARLFKAGHDVHFLLRSDYEAVKTNGLSVKSFEGDFHIKPPVYDSPESLGMEAAVEIEGANSRTRLLAKPATVLCALQLILRRRLEGENAVTLRLP